MCNLSHGAVRTVRAATPVELDSQAGRTKETSCCFRLICLIRSFCTVSINGTAWKADQCMMEQRLPDSSMQA